MFKLLLKITFHKRTVFLQVNPTAAFSDAFASRGATWAKYIVSVGAMSGMTTSLVSL